MIPNLCCTKKDDRIHKRAVPAEDLPVFIYNEDTEETTMNRNVHIIITVILILIPSRFAVRIADAVGKISSFTDVLMLVIPVIAVTGMISYAVYRYRSKHV